MEQIVTKISKTEYLDKYSNCTELSDLITIEDVATFIDTFEASNLKGYNVVKVISIRGKYIFVFDEDNTGFDFFEVLKGLNKTGLVLNAQNAKLLFPKEMSRGYCTVEDLVSLDVSTGDLSISKGEENETPTGLLDEDDLDLLERTRPEKESRFVLIHTLTNNKIPINDNQGVIIGRSFAYSDYAVSNTKVSRKHARVYKSANKCMVHDFGSANGTFIDGLKVSTSCDREILVGSTLRLGDEEFKLV